MPEKLRLKLWAPTGEEHIVEVPDPSGILPALRAWSASIGCRASEIDYQVNDGLRVLGEAGARRRRIDVCGLPRRN